MIASTHRRCKNPVNGNPTSVAAQRAISFADASNETLRRIMLRALVQPSVHPHHRDTRGFPRQPSILIIETPAYYDNQPAYYDKFLWAFELTATRFYRCNQLYNTPRRKETIVINNNVTTWRAGRPTTGVSLVACARLLLRANLSSLTRLANTKSSSVEITRPSPPNSSPRWLST